MPKTTSCANIRLSPVGSTSPSRKTKRQVPALNGAEDFVVGAGDRQRLTGQRRNTICATADTPPSSTINRARRSASSMLIDIGVSRLTLRALPASLRCGGFNPRRSCTMRKPRSLMTYAVAGKGRIKARVPVLETAPEVVASHTIRPFILPPTRDQLMVGSANLRRVYKVEG
jgi:hypothetical protein